MGTNGKIMNLNGVTGDAINILLTQRAMSPVPSLTANASSILALAMFRTACVARFLIALGSSPIVVAPKNHTPFRYSNSKLLFFPAVYRYFNLRYVNVCQFNIDSDFQMPSYPTIYQIFNLLPQRQVKIGF